MVEGLRVLVLEDSVLVAMAIDVALGEHGLVTISAGSIAAARARMNGEPVAVALLDLHLPDGSSLDLARELHAAGCAVALVSGLDAQTVPHDYPYRQLFRKPVSADRLADWVLTMVKPVERFR